MTSWGYTLSSEEHHPSALVRNAQRAEAAGFDFISISDHYHPWISEQGNSAFVWATIGGIAARTDTIRLGVGVTCPIIRMHPAVVAHASATVAAMLEREDGTGRFFFGVGTGENLNEHVIGSRWPAIEVRRAMLAEAVEVVRALWTGETVDHWGPHYTVENARLFTLPSTPPPIVVSAFGPEAGKLAGRIGDGLWSTSPDPDTFGAFEQAGGSGMRVGQLSICWAPSRQEAMEVAHRNWPNTSVPGQLSQDLPTWTHFEQAATLVTPELVAEKVVCGPDAEPVLEKIRSYEEGGFDHVHLHQVGPDQDGFFKFWEERLAPNLSR